MTHVYSCSEKLEGGWECGGSSVGGAAFPVKIHSGTHSVQEEQHNGQVNTSSWERSRTHCVASGTVLWPLTDV